MKKNITHIIALILLGLLSCKGTDGNTSNDIQKGDITPNAKMLTITEHDGYYIAEVTNPWQPRKLLQKLILVERNITTDNIPEDGIKINVPVKTSLVYSSAHAGVITEMGKLDAITGVCDTEFYKMEGIVEGLKNGKIIDAGSSMAPSIEKIIALNPEIIVVSPFQNAGHGAIEQLKIPIVEMADYMELDPLGRAEWIKLLGILYGCEDKASEIYENVYQDYNHLKSIAKEVSHRPKIINENITNGIWYMPGGNSYMAKMFIDAGGNYPWADDTHAGSLELDIASVYNTAHDADIWMTKTVGYDMTLYELKKINAINAKFKAFQSGNVYNCNTTKAPLFEEFPFHPNLLLRDFIVMFHPELLPDEQLRYYNKVK